MIRFGEAALQVMGLAEDHQVEDAKVAMGHAYGGAAQFFAMWIVSSSLDQLEELYEYRSRNSRRKRSYYGDHT